MQAGLVSRRLSFREIFLSIPGQRGSTAARGPRLLLCVLILVGVEVSARPSKRLYMAA